MQDPINLRQLSYFLAAADAGSMTAAATSLHVSQSAVSLAVSELERRLGIQLLHRHHAKGLTLTATGAAILADARALLAHADELRTTARSLGGEIGGRLVVGCFSTFAAFVLPRLLAGFQAIHPAVEIGFIEGSLVELQQLLRNGTCELALLYDVGIQSDIDCQLLYTLRPQVILHPEHRLASQKSVSLRSLSDEPFIVLDVSPSYEYYTQMFQDAGAQPNIRLRVGSFEMARALVARGFGFSMLVQRPALDLTYEGLPVVTRPVRDKISEIRLVLATAGGAAPTRRAKTFAQFCLESGSPNHDVPGREGSRRRPRTSADNTGSVSGRGSLRPAR